MPILLKYVDLATFFAIQRHCFEFITTEASLEVTGAFLELSPRLKLIPCRAASIIAVTGLRRFFTFFWKVKIFTSMAECCAVIKAYLNNRSVMDLIKVPELKPCALLSQNCISVVTGFRKCPKVIDLIDVERLKAYLATSVQVDVSGHWRF